MNQVFALPPNFDAISAVFDTAGKGVLFCYGDTVYNPNRVKVPLSLVAHETVHSRRPHSIRKRT